MNGRVNGDQAEGDQVSTGPTSWVPQRQAVTRGEPQSPHLGLDPTPGEQVAALSKTSSGQRTDTAGVTRNRRLNRTDGAGALDEGQQRQQSGFRAGVSA